MEIVLASLTKYAPSVGCKLTISTSVAIGPSFKLIPT